MTLLASIVTVGYILVQYTEEASLPLVVPAPLTDTPLAFHSREKCSMILRPNFIYSAIFLIFQIWLSGQWHMFLWCDKLITQIYCCFTQTLSFPFSLSQTEAWVSTIEALVTLEFHVKTFTLIKASILNFNTCHSIMPDKGIELACSARCCHQSPSELEPMNNCATVNLSWTHSH